MRRTWSRKEIYEAIWKQPVTLVAPRFGVSDVALAKACRRAAIPVPPRGYWARVHAGHNPKQPPLPPPPPGSRDRVSFRTSPPSPVQVDEAELEEEIPVEPPTFPDDLAERTERTALRVRRVVVPSLRKRTHPEIQEILDRAEERVGEREHHWTAYDASLLASKPEVRRLKLLNALFLAFERLGYSPSVHSKARAREVRIAIDKTSVPLMLESPHAFGRYHRSYAVPNPLELRIAAEHKPDHSFGSWDERKVPLERQLREVVIGVLVADETQHREWQVERYQLLLEIAEDKVREERARVEAAERARVDRLLRDVRAFRLACDIREFVSARLEAHGPTQDLVEWSEWALEKARAIDPAMKDSGESEPAAPELSPWWKRQPECGARDEWESLARRAAKLKEC